MPCNHLIFCHPFLFLPSIFPSIRVFSSDLALGIRQPKYCNFNFSISPSSEFLPLNVPPELAKKQKGQSWKRISQSYNANVPPSTSLMPRKSHQPMINSAKVTPQFSSVVQLCPTLCDPMNCSTPGLPVHHQFPEFTQTHVRRVSDAIQTFYPLLSLCPPAPSPSQHQSLFQ